MTTKISPLAKLALTDKVAHANVSRAVFHAARMFVPRVPSWVPANVKADIMSRAIPGLLCDRKSNGVGPASRYHCVTLQDGTFADVTCKKCRKILGMD